MNKNELLNHLTSLGVEVKSNKIKKSEINKLSDAFWTAYKINKDNKILAEPKLGVNFGASFDTYKKEITTEVEKWNKWSKDISKLLDKVVDFSGEGYLSQKLSAENNKFLNEIVHNEYVGNIWDIETKLIDLKKRLEGLVHKELDFM